MKKYIIFSLIIMALFSMNLIIEQTSAVAVSADDQWYDYRSSSYAGGDGSSSNPYLIATAEQLALMNYDMNILHKNSTSSFKLVSDIDLGNHHWQPIGMNIIFYGVFDGGDHIIKNMTILKSSYCNLEGVSTNYAFFGYCRYATIKNVTFINAYIEGNENATCAGIVSGDTSDDTIIDNVLVIDSYINTKAWSVGGIAGWHGKISNCYVSGTRIINNGTGAGGVGGIIGHCVTTVENSYYQGYIESYIKASGISGCESSTITNSGSYIESNSKNVASGINYNYQSTIINCASNVLLNNSNATVTNSYFGDGSNVPSSFYNDKWTSVSNINSGFPILKQFVW